MSKEEAERTADRILREWRKGASGEAHWTHSDGTLLVHLIRDALLAELAKEEA